MRLLSTLLVLALSSLCLGQNARSVALVNELLGPAVRVHNDTGSNVGSGTVVYSKAPRGTFVLTNFHVVSYKNEDTRCLYRFLVVHHYTYLLGVKQDISHESGHVVAYDEHRDLAIIQLDDTKLQFSTAKLASDAQAKKIRVFDELIEVGCPLRIDPGPTRGMLTSMSVPFEMPGMWLSSTPTVYGNSGGAVYDQIDGEWRMIGIPTIVVNALPPDTAFRVPVYHMNLMVSCVTVNDWIRDGKLAFIIGETCEDQDRHSQTATQEVR